MLYEDFWKSSCDWRKTTIYREVTNTLENKKAGCRRWLTRKQMLPIFDNDEGVVDGIIMRKCNDPDLAATETRKHPEEPSLMQYLVLTEDWEESAETNQIREKFKMKERDRSDASSDESSSRDSQDDDDDSDSSDGKGRKKGSKRKESKKKKNDKAISDINSRVRAANEKIKNMSSMSSPKIKNAMESEINSLVSSVTRFRTSLQDALDSGLEDMCDAHCGGEPDRDHQVSHMLDSLASGASSLHSMWDGMG
eukprot:Skav228958  [mRNA]  locus=scaffold2141:10535:12342:+ [translate_table: standard]